MKISDLKTYDLYHGTSSEAASHFCKNGWTPNSGSIGGNMGQPKYLYLTNEIDNARWFANESGNDVIVLIRNVPEGYLKVDPEDGTADSVNEELNNELGLPGYVVLTKPLSFEHFSIVGS